jgi:ADP-ribosylglycohydrolase
MASFTLDLITHFHLHKQGGSLSNDSIQSQRVDSALRTSFIADALAMPVHWYYQPLDIEMAFKGGITRFEAAPQLHPSSIMSLHSKNKGGRQSADKSSSAKSGNTFNKPTVQVVGDIILKDKAQFWDTPNVHYHQGMKAGENTLNAHCARLLMRTLAASSGDYNQETFLAAYIDFMTAQPPAHADTYAESYHRGFFANLAKGRKPDECAMKTHDTASIGGLVTIGPLVFAQGLKGVSVSDIQIACRAHLALTHPDESLMQVCDSYVMLLYALMSEDKDVDVQALLIEASKSISNFDLAGLVKRDLPDHHVVGHLFSRACYISDAWPIVLYLSYKYQNDPWQALKVNTNLGGDNVHRGIVLGTILGLQTDAVTTNWFKQLVDHKKIATEIDALVNASTSELGAPKP